MICELSIDTAGPGKAAKVLDLIENVRIPQFAGPDRLLGVWVSEMGPVNQVIQLRSYDDRATWAWASAAHSASESYRAAYETPLQALCTSRERRLLTPAKPFRTDLEPGHFYELRVYSLIPGGARRFVEPMLKILPFRERYSANVGVFLPESGNLDQIVHMWAYRDLRHRSEVRGGLAKQPEWQEYLKVIFPLIDQMHCTMLLPAAFSPAR